MFGNTEQSDRNLSISSGARVASQSLCPHKTIMGPFGTGKRRESDGWSGVPRLDLDLHALVTKQADTGTPVNPATPIMPEDTSRAHCHRMQQDAHLARLCRRSAIPLALLM